MKQRTPPTSRRSAKPEVMCFMNTTHFGVVICALTKPGGGADHDPDTGTVTARVLTKIKFSSPTTVVSLCLST